MVELKIERTTFQKRDLLLEELPVDCKAPIFNKYQNRKLPKETNWKQIFRKHLEENICLTYLNVDNIGNFPIWAFGVVTNSIQIHNLP